MTYNQSDIILYPTENDLSLHPTGMRGGALLNTLINNLPFEIHIPGYQYCGPGTKLETRLQRGDTGINPLDKACQEHDIAYHSKKNILDRHKADQILIEQAKKRGDSKDASIWERSAARTVASLLTVKMKAGAGMKKKKRRRQIPLAKLGGFILPLMAGLGTAVTAGATVAKTLKDVKNAKKLLEETERHNRAMESIAKNGTGLFLKPYKKTGGNLKKIKKTKKKSKKKTNFLQMGPQRTYNS